MTDAFSLTLKITFLQVWITSSSTKYFYIDYFVILKRRFFNLSFITDDSNTLAVRWSAVESLQKDEFSIKSDTWMFALFIYEVFTHGCWPYSEQTGKETDDTMHMVSAKFKIRLVSSSCSDK